MRSTRRSSTAAGLQASGPARQRRYRSGQDLQRLRLGLSQHFFLRFFLDTVL